MADFYDTPPTEFDEVEPDSKEQAILQWCDARLREGIKFVEESVGYNKIDEVYKEMFLTDGDSTASYIPSNNPLNQTRADLLSVVAEDVVAMLTDTRCFWNYQTKNKLYEQSVKLSNDQTKIWYNKNNIDLRIGDGLRYYTAAGTGILYLFYSRQLDDFMLKAVDPRMVFPIEPIDYHTFQTAKGVILRSPKTPEWVWLEYGKNVKPDTNLMGRFWGWIRGGILDGPGQGGPLTKKAKADVPTPGVNTVFINTMYLRDSRTNKTDKTVRVGKFTESGKPANNWSYEVKPNEPLYPFGRLIVWSEGRLLSDGPNWNWSGQFPVIKLTLNPWPDHWFGKAPLWGCLPLARSINKNLRVIDDHAAQVAQPGMVADKNVSRAEVNKLNTRQAGYKIRTNRASGKGIEIVPPPPLDSVIWEAIKWCEEKMRVIAGVVDISSMASLNQIPSDDTIDTIMKAMTPGIRMRSRILEGAYKELANMVMWAQLQFDTTSKRLAMLGPDGVTKEDYDYIPGDMIPDNIPGGEPGDIAHQLMAEGTSNPPNRYTRAKAMLASWGVYYDPSSLLNTAAHEDLMKYFLLAKMGYISVFTLMEKMGIGNFAPPSLNVPPDEVGRLQLQAQLGIGMIANAQGRKATDQAPASMGQNAAGPTIQTS